MNLSPRFSQFLESSRFIDVQCTKLLESNKIDETVFELLSNYFVAYISHFKLTDEAVVELQMNFLMEYNKHLKIFEKTNKYPYENQVSPHKERLDYDIPLLCSTFVSYQRYLIFETLYTKINVAPKQSILVVGVGPGIELAMLNEQSKNIFAYDTAIGDFIKETFPDVHFKEQHFSYQAGESFDKILMIELLEHLENPEALLIDAMKALAPGGRIHFTTAVNIPQFDHLYKFDLNDKSLEKCIHSNQFEIEFKLDIPHNYMNKVDAYSCYYILKRANDI